MAIKPIFHLQPEKNWMNDPNGLCFIGEQFHMFYQHNPFQAVWGNMTWGHAVSPDMVHWRRLQNALHPDMPYDKDGVFSGCCVVRDGIPHILYTGVYPETLCLAIGDESGMAYDKYSGNPILTRGGRKLAGWRDPYVWRRDGIYNMLIGSGDDSGGFTELYQSENLINWDKIGLFAHAKDYDLHDRMWECPVFMYNDNKEAALVVSAAPFSATRLFTGVIDNGIFSNSVCGALDFGDCLYAPNIVRHPDGRWIMFGWQRETGDNEHRAAQGWQGMLTLPRELQLFNGALYASPAREVDSLRSGRLFHDKEIVSSTAGIIANPHYEIDAHVYAGKGQSVFNLLDNGDASVCISVSDGGVSFTNGYAQDTPGAADITKKFIQFEIMKKDAHAIRIYVDGTSIEVYVDSRYTLTTRAYPDGSATRLRVSAENGCIINELDVYAINDCYNI